jgi:hypothetical protein
MHRVLAPDCLLNIELSSVTCTKKSHRCDLASVSSQLPSWVHRPLSALPPLFLFIFVLLGFLFGMGFRCPAPECSKRPLFGSSGALSNHKRACKAWKIFSESANLKPAEVDLLSKRKRQKTSHPSLEGPDPGFIPTYNSVTDGADATIQPSTLPNDDFQVHTPKLWVYVPVTDILYQTIENNVPQAPDRSVYSTRSGRQRRLPRRFDDMIPSLPTLVPHLPPPVFEASPEQEEREPSTPPAPSPMVCSTPPNSFGMYREYTSFPRNDPENIQTLDNYSASPNLANSDIQSREWWAGFGGPTSATEGAKQFYAPFMNATIYRLMKWFYSSTTKSLADLDSLVTDVLRAPDYDVEHLKDFSSKKAARDMDRESGMLSEDILSTRNRWIDGEVKLKVPVEGKSYASETDAPVYTVKGVHYRHLVDVISAAFSEKTAASFHYIPFKTFWRSTPNGPPERIFTELYNSDAFLEEHAKLQQEHSQPNPNIAERAVAAIMLWSDSTHLANFGTAALWPIYCYFGNQSKYERTKPSSFAAHHLAYIPEVSRSSIYDTFGFFNVFCIVAASVSRLVP